VEIRFRNIREVQPENLKKSSGDKLRELSKDNFKSPVEIMPG
jgi:hypothetical protein